MCSCPQLDLQDSCPPQIDVELLLHLSAQVSASSPIQWLPCKLCGFLSWE